jgi:hypothetical protein
MIYVHLSSRHLKSVPNPLDTLTLSYPPHETQLGHFQIDSTFEAHYTIGDLAKQWPLGRETVRLLLKDEPGVLKIRLGRRKSLTRYSVPESVARRVHTKLFNPAI